MRQELQSFSVIVLFIWGILSTPLLKAEWMCLQQTPSTSRQSVFDQKFLADGPIYLLAFAAQEAVPSGESLVFITSASGGEKEYYEGKLRYYLWPRGIAVLAPQGIGKDPAWQRSNYALFFSEEGTASEAEKALRDQASMEKIFEYRENGHYAIYKKKPEKRA